MLNQIEVEYDFPEKLGPLFRPCRNKVAYGGRGGTKSWGFARALLLEGSERPMRILCAREVQKSIKDSVHKLLSDQVQNLGLGSFYQVLTNEIRGKNGTEFIFTGLSSQTTESIKSFEGIDRCWVEEAHKVSRRSWDILIPTIRKDGSEIWISLNPELDTDETYVRFIENPSANTVLMEVNWRDNPWFPKVLDEERKEFLRQVEIGLRERDEYDNIWEGKCKSAVDGAIYYKEITAAKIAGRLRDVPYDPMLKVHTVWDLGRTDNMAILFVQKVASEIRIIDYIEDTHRTLADYIKSEEGREDLDSRNYRWGKDYLPHDAKHKTILADKSAQGILEALGRDVEVVPDIGVENGIKNARLMFPRVYFDKEKAGPLFNRLSRYKRKISAETQQPGSPLHDSNSDGSDGFRYLAVIESQMTNEETTAEDPYAGFRRG